MNEKSLRAVYKVFVDIMPGSYTIETNMREGNAGLSEVKPK